MYRMHRGRSCQYRDTTAVHQAVHAKTRAPPSTVSGSALPGSFLGILPDFRLQKYVCVIGACPFPSGSRALIEVGSIYKDMETPLEVPLLSGTEPALRVLCSSIF